MLPYAAGESTQRSLIAETVMLDMHGARENRTVFFDADFAVGGSGRGLKPPPTAIDALRVMDHYGIQRALVYDRSSMEMGAFDKWADIIRFCSKAPERLLPTIPVVPPACGEMTAPEELVSEAVAAGVVGLRVWPEYHAFDLNPDQWETLVKAMQCHNMPLIVHLDEQHAWQYRRGWNDLAKFAMAFPSLTILALWAGMRDGRRFLPLLDTCPNVLLDGTPVTFQLIEFVTRKWGGNRLVFASHYPLQDPSIYLTPILYADISPKDRENIAGRNIAQIVEAVK